MPSRYQTGIGGKLGPQATAGSSGPYVGQPPSSVRNIQPKTVKPTATAQPQGLGRFFGGITRLGGAMQALNPNAPMLDRMIGSLTAGFPITGMTASTLQGAYNYGKNPYGGMSSIVETDLSSAIQAENSKADMKTIKEKMIKDAGGLEQYNKLYPAAAEGGYTISPKVRQELAEERVNPKVETETPPPVPAAETGAARLDPNATEEYKTAFKAGQKKMDDMLKYFGSQSNGKNLQTWARANPALAYKEFKKAGMTGKEPFAYNEVVYGKLEEKDNPEAAAKKLGIKIYDGQADDTRTPQEKFAQAFLGDAIKGLTFGKYENLDANPYQIDPAAMLNQPVDFNIPGLAGTLGNYGTADYGELLKKYPNIFSYK